jgi:pimeloyl-[acyl-carrier protein] methyl ester esterase
MNARVAPPLHVEATGNGPALVLLHGFAMHGGLFAPLLPELAPRFRVHAVDLPGHGCSAPGPVRDIASLARAIDEATAAVEGPLIVVGWSLGGQAALQWALARPERVGKLVLVATTPSFVARDDWPSALATDALARFGDELRVAYRLTLLRFLTLQMQGSEDGRRTLAQLRGSLFDRGEPSPATLASTLAILVGTDLRSSLHAISAPALVIAGERDTLVPVAATHALAAALPRASHATIAGAAHAPFLSHPDAFLDALGPFVDG